ncbi:unnamed protein product [Clonostachys rosea]|uniref:NADP-dependent oxidoreductase domain-containing protein n=1 Tax=Bionectria ochroleuca TaxID=29856 RepID=A0ABY6UUW1_BIOOC|nr:unnamed protein product [Clonostachys rosea]
MSGCMVFGSSKWDGSPWIVEEDYGLQLLKAANDRGRDTVDTYLNGISEEIIGKALRIFQISRQSVVIMTKIYNPVPDEDSRPPSVNDGSLVNWMGLSRKHIFYAVDMCFKRLGTDYIDVLQIHRLNQDTEPEEIMRALHDVVQPGKYAISEPRRCIPKSNGRTEFIPMQPLYNLLYREEEREMIPFCRSTGVGIIPWSPVARGLLTKPLDSENASLRSRVDKGKAMWFADANLEIVDRVEEVANRRGVSMALVATAWVLQKGCWPIIGLSSVDSITETVQALNLRLSEDEIFFLEERYRPRAVTGI